MPLRKLKDLTDDWTGCQHPEHDPPMFIYLENGVYEYECPSCGRKTTFTVRRPNL